MDNTTGQRHVVTEPANEPASKGFAKDGAATPPLTDLLKAAEELIAPRPRAKRGFAVLSPEKKREIASMGGKAAHEHGRAHRFTSEEARAAGKKRHQLRMMALAAAKANAEGGDPAPISPAGGAATPRTTP